MDCWRDTPPVGELGWLGVNDSWEKSISLGSETGRRPRLPIELMD